MENKRAVILAGGKGVRLKPYTTVIPKPLVPIGGEFPILEIVIRQLKFYGFTHITIALNHLAELMKAFFGDGKKWEIKIDYSLEEKPLSTIGPLTLIKDLPSHFLVMNGDVLCNLDYNKLLNAHLEKKAALTVATFKRKQKIDFGVIEYNLKNNIFSFEEKPEMSLNVSMGVYVISREYINNIPQNQKYGFDDLMLDGLKNKTLIQAFPFDGYWLDIGRPDDYDQANEEFQKLRNIFLPAE
jgi:NDP-mannose synthase